MSPHLLSGAARMAGSSLLRLQADERLVALVRDGHDPAFSALVDRYRAELLRYATRLVGESRAEDVVQQSLLNAHTALVSSENDIQLRPWLYRIAHNAALNVLRSSRDQVALDDRLAAPGAGVAHDLETRERLRDALAAIARLPEAQRDALTLQALEGRSHEEIAGALAVTPGAARQHLHRARATVRAAVSAVTPYGLMARFAMAGDDPATGVLLSGAGAGAGLAATATKVGAGVLAAGAIAGGAVGHVPFVAGHDTPRAPGQRHVPPRAEAAAAAAPVRIAEIARPVPVPGSHGRAHPEDDGRADDHGSRHRSSGEGSSGHGSGRDGASGRRSTGDDGSSGHEDASVRRSSGDDGSGGRSGSDDRLSGTSGGPGDDGAGDDGVRTAEADDHSGSGSSGSGSADTSRSGSGSSGDDD